MSYKVAATFDVDKYSDDEAEIIEWDMILSHPVLQDWFMFYEDIETYFFDLPNSGWEKLENGKSYRVFLVMNILPQYSYHYEYGKDFDGWDWDIIVLTYEDMGKINEDDTSIQP